MVQNNHKQTWENCFHKKQQLSRVAGLSFAPEPKRRQEKRMNMMQQNKEVLRVMGLKPAKADWMMEELAKKSFWWILNSECLEPNQIKMNSKMKAETI